MHKIIVFIRNIIHTLNNDFREELLLVRKRRGAKFLFIPKNNLGLIIRVLAAETMKKSKKADNILLTGVLADLVTRQIIPAKSVRRYTLKLGDFTYYDINIQTFDNQNYSRGTSTDEMEAYAKALGEVFERFTLKHYKNFTTINTNFYDTNLQHEILGYQEYPQPTKNQLVKIANFNIDQNLDKFNFTKLPDIKTGQEKYVLIQTLTLNKEFLTDAKNIVLPTTNGAGAGYSLSQAQEAALMEIMHRHFFLNSWFSKKVYPKITLHEDIIIKSNLGKKKQELEKNGFKIYFVNLSESSNFPTVLCILEKLGGWYMGGASKNTLYKACERSLDEAISIFTWSCRENIFGTKIYDKNILDTMPNGFVDFSVTSKLKVDAFANSYFVHNFDQFFISGFDQLFTENELFKVCNSKAQDGLPGPVFQYIFKTELLEDYDYHLVKCYAPHTQYFSLEEAHTKPIIKGGPEIVFDQINPFP